MGGGTVTDAELIAALLARLGGSVVLGRREMDAAKGWRIATGANQTTGDVHVELRS